jgi:hypothetical protein
MFFNEIILLLYIGKPKYIPKLREQDHNWKSNLKYAIYNVLFSFKSAFLPTDAFVLNCSLFNRCSI